MLIGDCTETPKKFWSPLAIPLCTVIIHGVPPRRATGRIERSPESQEAPSYREHPRRTPKKRGWERRSEADANREIEKALGGGFSLEPLRGFLCFESARVTLRRYSPNYLQYFSGHEERSNYRIILNHSTHPVEPTGAPEAD
jgi:hypothetical protein